MVHPDSLNPHYVAGGVLIPFGTSQVWLPNDRFNAICRDAQDVTEALSMLHDDLDSHRMNLAAALAERDNVPEPSEHASEAASEDHVEVGSE